MPFSDFLSRVMQTASRLTPGEVGKMDIILVQMGKPYC